MNKDYSISFARCVAMIFIITCHILQYFNLELAWWFNVGVQMFLFISGYLYGRKKIDSPLKFYKKTFTKILADYYIYILIFIVGYFVINKQFISFGPIVNLLTFSSTVEGIRHLWFIPYILFCYLLTPLLIEVFNAIERKKQASAYLLYLIVAAIAYIAIMQFCPYFKPAYIVCFILGMIMKRLEKYKTSKIAYITTIILTAAIMNGTHIYLEYFDGTGVPLWFEYCAHVMLGASLVIVLRYMYRIFKRSNLIRRILDLSDKYSYDVYITHHIYILSPISLYSHYAGIILPTTLTLVLTVASAIALNKISTITQKMLKN